jgi:hypothetical protein
MKISNSIKIALILIVLSITHSNFGQSCADYLNWTDYPASHVFFDADEVYFEEKVYSPCYFSTTAPLSDPFVRDENGCGTRQWGFVTNCSSNPLSNDEVDFNELEIKSIISTKQIIITGESFEDIQVNIYDISGKLIMQTTINVFATNNSIDLNNLITGIYIVQLKNNAQTISKQIIIK